MKMSNKIKFKEDDLDDNLGDGTSDEEYTEREKFLVKKYKSGKKKAPESDDEVLGFGSSDDENDDDAEDTSRFDHDSDLASDHGEDDGIPDVKAWGKTKSMFYNTNYVDQDYNSLTQRDEENAELEEKEAREIQQQLVKHLKEADFSLDVFGREKSPEVVAHTRTGTAAKVRTDLSGMTTKQKLQLLKKDSPELNGLIDEMNLKIEESYNELEPIIDELQSKNVPTTHPIVGFIRLKNQLHLTYVTNITFYLLLKASQKSTKNHPILKRLVQLRELLNKLDEKYEEHIRPEVERLLEDLQSGKPVSFAAKEKKSFGVQMAKTQRPKLKAFTKMQDSGLFGAHVGDQDEDDDDEEGRLIERKMELLLQKVKQQEATDETMDMSDEEEDGAAEEAEGQSSEEEGVEKRKITYQIAKNKGLTPHRKKEQRNPRVKHRQKFRKALIRRKGAVRTVRTELSRYSGEHSGIKATVRKGVQIK